MGHSSFGWRKASNYSPRPSAYHQGMAEEMAIAQDRSEGLDPPDAKTQLIARVVQSRLFSKAPKLRQFLLYVAEHSLNERLDLVTESYIGVEVFARRDSYSPGEDNIVRSYARTLRKRLEEYFATDGASEELVVDMPRGGYVLVFRKRDATTGALACTDQPDATPDAGETTARPTAIQRTNLGRAAAGAAMLAALALLLLGAYSLGTRHAAVTSSSRNIHLFWTALLGDRETVIVPSDTGLTLVLGLIQRDVSVQEYVTSQHLKVLGEQYPQLQGWDRPISHRYTDLVDVMATRQFDHTPEISSRKTSLRYARDLKVDELEKGNAILLGGSNANPWVQLFDKDLNFHLHFLPQERTFRVENRHPLNGEPSEYPYATGNAQPYAYGLIALVPNLSHTGYALLLEGVTNSGLQATISTLADEKLMSSIVAQVVRADGSLRPAEFLVRTNGVGGASVGFEIIGSRVRP
jgi:hypothetical protein